MIGLVLGAFIGWLSPDWGNKVYFLRDIFLNLIKAIIAPLVFSTIVIGIAGVGALRKVGRMGLKALILFEIVTTAALFIGLAAVNILKPGVGVTLESSNTTLANSLGQTHPKTLIETIVHAFPSSVIDAMARGDVLQIVTFAVIFALALSAIGEKGTPVVRAMESLAQIMFKFTSYVMMMAPVGVGAAMAHTVATQGLGVLLNLGKLVVTLYVALIVCVVFVFGIVMLIARVPIRQFVRAVREPAALAFATTSSESALPLAMENMERVGVPAHIVGFVMPTGYSFNLVGSTLYQAVAAIFVVQAAETTTGFHMGFGQQVMMMLALMISSKGTAGVPRASLVILLALLNNFLPAGMGPLGVAVIFGVDELMDMGRTCVNVVGNCLATVVVARWEGEFDEQRASAFGTDEEVALNLKAGDVAFADAVRRD